MRTQGAVTTTIPHDVQIVKKQIRFNREFDPSNAGRRNHEKLSGHIVAGYWVISMGFGDFSDYRKQQERVKYAFFASLVSETTQIGISSSIRQAAGDSGTSG